MSQPTNHVVAIAIFLGKNGQRRQVEYTLQQLASVYPLFGIVRHVERLLCFPQYYKYHNSADSCTYIVGTLLT